MTTTASFKEQPELSIFPHLCTNTAPKTKRQRVELNGPKPKNLINKETKTYFSLFRSHHFMSHFKFRRDHSDSSMATLQKFKLLASQCAASPSPTQSPTASPVFHLGRRHRRQRKTLRMLLSRASDLHPHEDHRQELQEDKKQKRVRRKLKDLLVSSPPIEDEDKKGDEVGLLPVTGSSGVGVATRRGGGLRSVSATFRYRLLRRAWRPVLVTIPE